MLGYPVRPVRVVLLLALVLAGPAMAQQAADRIALERAARELITGAAHGTLITLGLDGHPQARTVDNFAPEADFTVWIGTNPRTRKVAEIRRDPRVTLHWFDPKRLGYVTLIGLARLVNDSAEKARHWKPEWAGFYPDRDRDYLLVQVRPLRLEIVSPAHGITGDSLTWKPPTVNFRTPAPKRP